jgi:Zn-dependent membrane protease YugP
MQAARMLQRHAELSLRIEGTRGELSDHYDPRKKILRLSDSVARSSSIGAVAIVAHEFGHAVQDARAFALLRLRSGLVPVVNFTSWLGPILFVVGMMLSSQSLATIGVLFFAGAVVFSLLTLPVELDASRRAIALLKESGIVQNREGVKGARKVLSAAALTYVAALAQSLSTMLYYVMMLGGMRRRRR